MQSARTRPTRQPSRPASDPPAVTIQERLPHMPDPSFLTGQYIGALIRKDDLDLLPFLIGFVEAIEKA